MGITSLAKINVKNFRALKDVNISIGSDITVICGKNGTAKSTILGLIAQIFSFEMNYATGHELKCENADGTKDDYRTLTGKRFTSQFKEHFRLSKKFDVAGSMQCNYQIFDGLLNREINTLSLSMTNTEGRDFRTVVRGNLTTEHTTNTSRNVTHPVIYQSLKRLIPLAERTKYDENVIEYLNENKNLFISISNKILGKRTSNLLTATSGTLDSAVAHSENYDHESVSAGEDNCGQLVLSLMSFKKLKDDLGDQYSGGILLIDEVDAGFFPAAQKNLIETLMTYAKELSLQIIMTSHSPIIIEEVKKRSSFKGCGDKYKVIYLSNAHGSIKVYDDYSWDNINADLNIETLPEKQKAKLPKVNVYFEDKEASDFFSALVTSRHLNSFLNKFDNITNGSSFYTSLMDKKIPEFTTKSIVVLDADVKNTAKYKNALKLPGTLPPDQLIFDFLFKLPANDDFWTNQIQYTKEIFLRDTSNILDRLELSDEPSSDYDLSKLLKKDLEAGNKKIREIFKSFYKSENLQRMLKKAETNPYRYYLLKNPEISISFLKELENKLTYVLTEGYALNLAYVKVELSPN